MKYKHIVWDWNGTLLNDKDLAVTAINVLLRQYDLPTINLNKYLEIFSFPVEDYYKRLGFDFEKTPFSKVGTEFINEYTSRMLNVEMHDNAKNMLQYVNKINIPQSLLSAAKQQMLDELMQYHSIAKYFMYVAGLDNHYANSKLDIGKILVQKLDLPTEQILFVGDTLHDVSVADAIGANCVLLSHGHTNYNRLTQSGKKVFSNFNELKDWLEV